MNYYKTGKRRTISLIWNDSKACGWPEGSDLPICKPPYVVRDYYNGNEKLGDAWKELYINDDNIFRFAKRAVIVKGSNENGIWSYPSSLGKIQYRAYACKPVTERQFLQGILIDQKSDWWNIARKVHGIKVLGFPSDSSSPNWCRWCRQIYVVAFFIPTRDDRTLRRYRRTYSAPKKIVVCPPCSDGSCGNSHCYNSSNLISTDCNCLPNARPIAGNGLFKPCGNIIEPPTSSSSSSVPNCQQPGPEDNWDYESLSCIPANTFGCFRLKDGSAVCIDPFF